MSDKYTSYDDNVRSRKKTLTPFTIAKKHRRLKKKLAKASKKRNRL